MRTLTLFSTFFLMSLSASATILITTGNSPQQPDQENILYNRPGTDQTGNPVIGAGNQTGFLVDFNSESDSSLTVQGGGQARIEGDFTDLTFNMRDSTMGFTSAIFNLNTPNNVDNTVTFSVGWLSPESTGLDETFTFELGNGSNFFTVRAVDQQVISFVNLETTSPLSDIRQVRIGGVQTLPDGTPGGDPGGEIPEPLTMGLMGFGLGGLALYRRFQTSKSRNVR